MECATAGRLQHSSIASVSHFHLLCQYNYDYHKKLGENSPPLYQSLKTQTCNERSTTYLLKQQNIAEQGYRLGIARLLVSCTASHHACSLTNYPLTHAHAHFCI